MKAKITFSIRLLLAGLFIIAGGSQARAWDTTPDENGHYDGLYDRPTHFPEWSQPSTWPNAMYYLCDVRLSDAQDGPRVPSYEIAVYDQNNELRFCGRSIPKDDNLSMLTIRGEEGDVFHFQVVYGDDFANPTIVDIPDVTVEFKTNDEVGTPTEPFTLVVPGRTYLRETEDLAIGSKTGVDVTVLRTISAGIWNTICLPFAIPADQLEAAFGTEVELGNFTGCDVTYEADGETVKQINVRFEAATAIEANHPYIIKVADDVTEINADNVDIIALDDDKVASVDCDEQKVKVGSTNLFFYNSFIGNYKNGFIVPVQKLFLSEGKFWYSMGMAPMMAFRAYFDFYNVLPEMDSSDARIAMSFNGEASIGRDLLYVCPSAQTSQVFDLQGRNVCGQLKKGIYIINNKKILVK